MLAPFLEGGGSLILDGGLATELETRGFDLNHPLWSARLLQEAPEAIVALHRTYLEAGADCIISASYQATVEGFVRTGHGRTRRLLGRGGEPGGAAAAPGGRERRALRRRPRQRSGVHR